jgi:MSHA biogenesis protein MshQ
MRRMLAIGTSLAPAPAARRRGVAAGGALLALLSLVNPVCAQTFVAASNATTGSSAATISVAKPAGIAANDLLLAQVRDTQGTGVTIATPAGWTKINQTNNSSNFGQAIYYKVATGSEPASYSWSASPADKLGASILAFRGISTSTPINVFGGQATAGKQTSVTAPSVTTTVANTMLVALFGSDGGSPAITLPGSLTSAYNSSGSAALGVSGAAGYTVKAAAGATGTYSATLSQSIEAVGHLVALTPGTSGAAGFKISNSSYGLYCLNQAITITAVDSGGSPYTGYTGTVNLTTTTNRGTWTLSSGGGTLTDSVPDDGAASYLWNSSSSVATFQLSYKAGAAVVTANAVDTVSPAIHDDGTQGAMTFAPSGFTVTSAPFSNPAGGVPAFASPQTAGNNFSLYLTAYGQTPTDSTCGIITSYAGAKSLKFWSSYVNPATGTIAPSINGSAIAGAEGSAAAQSVTFTSGQATVTARYRDAGSLSLSMKDDTTGNPGLPTGIRGSTGAFVSVPANFIVANIRRTSDSFANPAASSATGTVFAAAGQAFSATITAVESGGATTANFGRESVPESVAFTATLVLPVSGNNPAVSGTAGTFANGVATGIAFAWPEVGIIKLVPHIADGSYLGAGDVAGTATGNVGRFTPNSFAASLNTPVFATTCSAGFFGYVGQPFTYTVAPVISVTAQAVGGATTQNYSGAFFRLTNGSLTGRAYTPTPASPALDLSGLPASSADPAIVDTGSGQATLTFSAGTGLSFSRGSAVAPFNANIALAINVIDLDGVSAANPLSFGSGTGIAFSTSASQRYGRLALRNAVGSELLDLPQSLQTEYYLSSAAGFVTNTGDSCTTAPTLAFSGYQANLSSGEICVRDSGNPGSSGAGCAAAAAASIRYRSTALAGDFNLVLSAPGSGNDGAVTVTALAPTWLRYLWSAGSGSTSNPAGMATFGLFPGPTSRIYQREVY